MAVNKYYLICLWMLQIAAVLNTAQAQSQPPSEASFPPLVPVVATQTNVMTTVSVSGLAYNSLPWQVRVSQLPENLTAADLQARLQARLDEVNDVLSTYQPDTELMRLNRAPIGRWLPISPMLLHALNQALRVSAATEGAYDVTVGPLVNLWGFGPEAVPFKVPRRAAIATARAQVGWHRLELDDEHHLLRKQQAVILDMSSVGEGVGADELAAVLHELGIQHYLIAVAGTIRSTGQQANAQPWRVAVEQPNGSSLPALGLPLVSREALADVAVSTSGSYRNYYERHGVRYSHTIDPATGAPIRHHGVSVTVIATAGEGATWADAWATALNVLGPRKGLALAESLHIAAYFIEAVPLRSSSTKPVRFSTRYTRAFQPYLR